MSENQIISEAELNAVRNLSDFDLTMLLSEIHDTGWSKPGRVGGKWLLRTILENVEEYKHIGLLEAIQGRRPE